MSLVRVRWAAGFQDLLKQGAAVFGQPPPTRIPSPKKATTPRASTSKAATPRSRSRKSVAGAEPGPAPKRRSSAASRPRPSSTKKADTSTAVADTLPPPLLPEASSSKTSPRKSMGRMRPSLPPGKMKPVRARRSSAKVPPPPTTTQSASVDQPADQAEEGVVVSRRVPRASVAVKKVKRREVAEEDVIEEVERVEETTRPRASGSAGVRAKPRAGRGKQSQVTEEADQEPEQEGAEAVEMENVTATKATNARRRSSGPAKPPRRSAAAAKKRAREETQPEDDDEVVVEQEEAVEDEARVVSVKRRKPRKAPTPEPPSPPSPVAAVPVAREGKKRPAPVATKEETKKAAKKFKKMPDVYVPSPLL